MAENLKVLIWKNKGELSNKTYQEYIDHIAAACQMTPDRLRNIIRDDAEANGSEIASLRNYFEDMGYDLSAIEYIELFSDLLKKSGDQILIKNIQYLLKSLNRGENAVFVEIIGVNPSTVSRWKQGTTKPDKYSIEKIGNYFGYSDIKILRDKFLFLGIEPVSTQQRKQQCKELIDNMDKDMFEKLYPALVKLMS